MADQYPCEYCGEAGSLLPNQVVTIGAQGTRLPALVPMHDPRHYIHPGCWKSWVADRGYNGDGLHRVLERVAWMFYHD